MQAGGTAQEYDRVASKSEYEAFYSGKDFKHFGFADRLEIRSLVGAYGLKGKLVLDAACGTGWYTHLFNTYGVRAYGVELSAAGARAAARHYRKGMCMVGDVLKLPFPYESFDAVFLSGFPPFNTLDLDGLLDMGHELFRYVKPNGYFIFRKTTDLSRTEGSRTNHTLDQYRDYFTKLNAGPILGVYGANPITWALLRRGALSPIGTLAACAFTKVTHVPLRATVVVRKVNPK